MGLILPWSARPTLPAHSHIIPIISSTSLRLFAARHFVHYLGRISPGPWAETSFLGPRAVPLYPFFAGGFPYYKIDYGKKKLAPLFYSLSGGPSFCRFRGSAFFVSVSARTRARRGAVLGRGRGLLRGRLPLRRHQGPAPGPGLPRGAGLQRGGLGDRGSIPRNGRVTRGGHAKQHHEPCRIQTYKSNDVTVFPGRAVSLQCLVDWLNPICCLNWCRSIIASPCSFGTIELLSGDTLMTTFGHAVKI